MRVSPPSNWNRRYLAATLDVDDALAGEPLGEGQGEREADVRPAQLDLVDPGAEHCGRKAAPHSLDFGQFRHRESPTLGPQSRPDFFAS